MKTMCKILASTIIGVLSLGLAGQGYAAMTMGSTDSTTTTTATGTCTKADGTALDFKDKSSCESNGGTWKDASTSTTSGSTTTDTTTK